MDPVNRDVLETVLAGTVEPVVVVRVDQPDWPVALANKAFAAIGGEVAGKPFADVIEELGGRELALEVSEAVRSGQETSFPMEAGSREYLMFIDPPGAVTQEVTPPAPVAAPGRSGCPECLAVSAAPRAESGKWCARALPRV